MDFLVLSGKPIDMCLSDWCYIRMVSVGSKYASKGIGRQLTEKCIEMAKEAKEQKIALHTSDMMSKA